MADQGKWFKLWESALDDQDLENLSIHQWFCWARFGAYLKKHGKDGKIRLRAPATALINLFRLPSFSDVIDAIKSFPNYVVIDSKNETIASVSLETIESVTYEIKCINWSKYQSDYSTDRVRSWRQNRHHKNKANETLQEEKRRDVEEKRRDSPKPPLPTALHPTSTSGKNGNPQPASQVISTLKINGKQVIPDPEIPDSERMTFEEMEEIKEKNRQRAAADRAQAEDLF